MKKAKDVLKKALAAKSDVTTNSLLPWDEYRGRPPEEVLSSIYSHASATSKTLCTWYWVSIKTKRRTSLAVRFIAFSLLIVGTALPLLAGIREEISARLAYTQHAVAFLAVAGLLQIGDRVFGWSSGWMRYMNTVTAMEHMTRSFELDWAKLLLDKGAHPSESDVKSFFDLACAFEQSLLKLQGEETEKWISEFNAGMALLDSVIKNQREVTERTMESVRADIAAQREERLSGALEVRFSHSGDPVPVEVSLDGTESEEFVGGLWAKKGIASGQHIFRVVDPRNPHGAINKVVEIPAAGVSRITIDMLEVSPTESAKDRSE